MLLQYTYLFLDAKDFARLSVKDEQGNSHWKKDRDERRKQKPVRNSNPVR